MTNSLRELYLRLLLTINTFAVMPGGRRIVDFGFDNAAIGNFVIRMGVSPSQRVLGVIKPFNPQSSIGLE
jgi:hypothetical protein